MALNVAVCGLGAFGRFVGTVLYKEGCEVLGLDRDADLVQALKDAVTQTAVVDVRDRDALQSLGIGDVDIAVVAMGNSVATSILLVQHLAKLGVPQIIAKATSEEHAEALAGVGATTVSFPEKDVAERLAHHIIRPNVLDYIPLEKGFSVAELLVPESFAGKSIVEVGVRREYGLAILAVAAPPREDGGPTTVHPSPSADFRFEAGQTMLLYGTDADIARIRDVA